MVTAFMPETPILVFIAMTVFLSANGARHGIEITGRWSEMVAVGIILSVTTFVLPFQTMDFQNLLPILPYGLGPHLKRAVTIIAVFLRLSVLGMIIPYTHNRKEILRYTRYAVLVSGIMLIAQSVALGGLRIPLHSSVPSLQLARQISIGEFFERIEIIPVIVWFLNAGVNIATYIWASSLGLVHCSISTGFNRWLIRLEP